MSDDKPFQCTAPGCGQVRQLGYHKFHFVPDILNEPVYRRVRYRQVQWKLHYIFFRDPENQSVLFYLPGPRFCVCPLTSGN